MIIADPGQDLETREERRAARLAVWVPWWRDATATKKKDIVWSAFLDFYRGMTPEGKGWLQAKVRIAMGAPDAALSDMKDWVYNSLSTRKLARVMTWIGS